MRFSRATFFARLRSMPRFMVAGALVLIPTSIWAQKVLTEEGGGQALTALARLQSNSTAPAPRNADGTPDLSGLWGPDKNFMYDISSALKPGETLPLQPWAAKASKEHMSNEDPNVRCRPSGIPRMTPYPWKVVQTPKLIVFLFEGGTHGYRQIFMDGRSHPKDLDPTYYGDSIGKWDGDTLVIDVTNQVGRTWLDQSANLHSDAIHVVERITPIDSNNLQYEATVDDSKTYTRPWTIRYFYSRILDPKFEHLEFACIEGEVDQSKH